MINAAFSAVSNLLTTIEFNVEVSPDDRLFQRQTWSFRLSPDDRMEFRGVMREMLERWEEKSMQAIEPWEMESYGDGLLTAGVGFYYFEEGAQP